MPYVDALSGLEKTDDGSKPWCDLVFDLIDLERRMGTAPSSTRIIAGRGKALALGTEIGFGFEIPLVGWTEKRLEDADLSIFFGKASLLSIGEATDHLIAFYEKWFELPAEGLPARPRNDCKAVLLGGSLTSTGPFAARTKLFFDFDDVDEHHAEMFFSIDTDKKQLRLSEKDPDYREPLLR